MKRASYVYKENYKKKIRECLHNEPEQLDTLLVRPSPSRGQEQVIGASTLRLLNIAARTRNSQNPSPRSCLGTIYKTVLYKNKKTRPSGNGGSQRAFRTVLPCHSFSLRPIAAGLLRRGRSSHSPDEAGKKTRHIKISIYICRLLEKTVKSLSF